MTPEKAQEIYIAARQAEFREQADVWSKPVIQKQADLKGWEAVIAAVRKETDDEWMRKVVLGVKEPI